MVLDGGAVSASAITSTFTAVLRISQAVYELKAVGEQTRDLLDTTKYVNSSLESVRELRRKKSDLLNREEKKWIDQQTEFTQKAVDSVAVLIERARVDMQAKSETGNEDDYKTKHIKIHHRARFVLEDGPKVQTNLMKVTMAMNGLNSAMVTLSSREGHDVHLHPSIGSTRRNASPGRAPPPYVENDFLNRRRTISASVQKSKVPQKLGFVLPGDQEASQVFGSQTVPDQTLHPRASMSSITPTLDFSSVPNDQYYENAIADDTTSPACLPTSSIRDSIGSHAYFTPHEMDNSTSPRPNTFEMDATTHPPLQTCISAPAVPTRAPTIPRKPLEYRQHRASTPSFTSVHDEFEQHLFKPWVSSTPPSHSPLRPPVDAQKDLPMLPLHLTPMASTTSLNSTISAPSSNNTSMDAPPTSRGRSWLMDRLNEASTRNAASSSRTQSSNMPYQYHSPDDIRSPPGTWT